MAHFNNYTDEFRIHFQAERRAHHNMLERKRRDHIKDSFTSLRDSVPSLQGEKVEKVMHSSDFTSLFIIISWQFSG